MKPQDLIFIIILGSLLFKKKPEWLVWAGVVCLILSIPLFGLWIFFTAQRLTYYAAAFFTASILLLLLAKSKK